MKKLAEHKHRGVVLGLAIDILLWAIEQRRPFVPQALADGVGISERSARRWIESLEARGVVERADDEIPCSGRRRFRWRTTERWALQRTTPRG